MRNQRIIRKRKIKILQFASWLFVMLSVFVLISVSFVLARNSFFKKDKFVYNDIFLETETVHTSSPSNDSSSNKKQNTKGDFIALKSDQSLFENVNVNTLNTDDFLQLVNYDHPIDKDVEEYENVPAFKIIPVLSSSVTMNPKALESVTNLLSKAKTVGYDDFLVNYGYRSYEEQENLYTNAADKSFVSKPGHSEHHTGLAADIAYKGISGENMGDSKEGIWLSENAWKYGFILRYPDDKTHITKISYEPWHFRYVGLPHAYYMYMNHMCLEEYIEYLKKNGEYTIELDGIQYSVFYQTAENDIIQLPADLKYSISGDNTGGYIVTYEEN